MVVRKLRADTGFEILFFLVADAGQGKEGLGSLKSGDTQSLTSSFHSYCH
jgi:hypothetical protein